MQRLRSPRALQDRTLRETPCEPCPLLVSITSWVCRQKHEIVARKISVLHQQVLLI